MPKPNFKLAVVFVLFGLLTTRISPGQDDVRWQQTAVNGSGLQQGDATTVTWGIVEDGVVIVDEMAGPSGLVGFLDTIIGGGSGGSDITNRPWFILFENAFDRIASVSGLEFQYEPNDLGIEIPSVGVPGELGILPDIRICGHSIDGQDGNNILAYAYYPDTGDMVFDTDNINFYSDMFEAFVGFRNVIGHETGHAVGIPHLESNDSSHLMEPFVSIAFDGPQIDDVFQLQRRYGDQYEKDGGNDQYFNATQLGSFSGGGIKVGSDAAMGTSVSELSPTQTDFVSIDDDSDIDCYEFSVGQQIEMTIRLDMVGPTYMRGPQGGSQSLFDLSSQSDLDLEVLAADGSTVLGISSASGLNLTEEVTISLEPGAYFVRITGRNDAAQFYELSLFSYATRIFYTEAFDYPDGNLMAVSSGLWPIHNGNPPEIQVVSGKAVVTSPGSADHNRLTGFIADVSDVWYYAVDFSVELNTATIVNNDYFIHFKDASVFGLNARLAIAAPSAGGDFSLQIWASSFGDGMADWNGDFSFGEHIKCIVRWDNETGEATLWVNPTDKNSLSIIDDEPVDAMRAIEAIGLRQDSTDGSVVTVESISAGADFDAVLSAIMANGDNSNFLRNSGFEDELNGWESTGNAAVRDSDPPPFEGQFYVYGQSTPNYTVFQDVCLELFGISGSQVDSGNLEVEFGGFQSGWNTNQDQGQISVRFLDESMFEIGRSELDFFFSNHTWVEQVGVADIPIGTRTLRYHFEGVRLEGSNNDAYLDAAFLRVPKSTLLGDINLDGIVDLLDVAPFVDLLTNGGFQTEADINQDGNVNLLDVESFVGLLSSG